MTLADLVQAGLRARGYDGLFNDAAECACLVDDLAPCGQPGLECRAGVRAECDCGEHDFRVVEREG